MGTDSHFFLERKTNKGPWCLDPGHKFEEDRLGVVRPLSIPSLSGRNYNFFGLLAGVRQCSIYAKPIAANRLLPQDVCSELKSLYEQKEYHFHNATYLTPRELEKAINRLARSNRDDWPDAPLILNTPARDAFDYDAQDIFRINDAVVSYVRSYLDWEKAENVLLGTKNRTRFRIILWFDS